MAGPIFIGGTGRSGTTILGRVLHNHKDIFVYPFETRFIVDPNGVIDLCENLSDKWTPHRGDYAVKKFIEFMNLLYPPLPVYILKAGFFHFLKKTKMINLISPFKYTYTMAGHWRNEDYYTNTKPPISVFIEREDYFKIINKFLDKIVIKEFSGHWTGTESLTLKPKIFVTRKFVKEEIFQIAGDFVNELLSQPLHKYKKHIWADHTPPNILFASSLIKMFPEAKIIHIYRDFRDVVCSYKTKSWGAKTTEDAVYSIKQILEKWDAEKEKIPKEKYIEISLEDLVTNTENTLEKLCQFLKIDFDNNMLKVDLSKSHSGRWKKELSKEDLEIVENYLRNYLEVYGYD